MGWKTNVLVLGIAVVTALYFSGMFSSPKIVPKLEDKWWGKGDKSRPDHEEIKEFTINVPDEVLEDLKWRLDSPRLPVSMEGTNFRYGFHSEYLKVIVDYWRNKYNWREHEKLLNSFNHYTTEIEGINIHFIHAKPRTNSGKRKPMLISHGWPGSVYEFYKLLPMLTDPAKYGGNDEDALEIVAPSIPGYGFSEASHKPGLSAIDVGRIFRKLMLRLGHEKFYVQGGDWGSIITTFIAQFYPQNIIGIHLNMIADPFDGKVLLKKLIGVYFPTLMWSAEDIEKIYPLMDNLYMILEESGYFHIQATKPDTVGVGLNDSPVGLAAYILEKFSTATNKSYIDLPDGGLTRHFTMDELLTNVMIYWTTGTITSAVRLYKEYVNCKLCTEMMSFPVIVPSGVAMFAGEVTRVPKSVAATVFTDIVQYTDLPSGGHFAALQEPLLMAKDIWSFKRKIEERKSDS